MRKRVFEIIEAAREHDRLSNAYDIVMMVTIFASLVPMAFKQTNEVFDAIETVAVFIFGADYLLRLWTADFKLKKGAASYLLYPFTPMALVDLISILP